ncbi:MAG: hypothetical protein KAS72_11070 [Phycisphaerales bacterium]|nr:hypothetical protein [Phycisphaerales bacterium]
MFDKTLRELKRLERGIRVSVELPLDEHSCMDRRCPSKACGRDFKVVFEDWRDKVSDERAYCPFCGHVEETTEWNTPSQVEHIEAAGIAHISRMLDESLGSDARKFNRQQRLQPRDGLSNFSMSMSYRPDRRPVPVPPAAAEALRQEFNCERCECRWSSLGASFFCPACGHNSAESAFASTIETVRNFVASVGALRQTLTELHNADVAEDTVRQLLEDQFGRVVGAFERVCEALFEQLPNEEEHPRQKNVFQRIGDASALWKAATGRGYDSFLSESELGELARFVQQRHVLGHKQGILDEAYIAKSGDRRFRPGQRLVVRDLDVLRLSELVEKLAAGLRTTLDSERPESVADQ